MSPEKLVYMANQIGRNFAHQGEALAIAGIADHIARFWDPRMRAALREHVRSGGAGLDPLVLRAVAERTASNELASLS